jgi:hypothetical protein
VPVEINGLPAHVLLVHAVVVLVPLAALMLVASAIWPAARAKLGFLTPAVALVALILVPITTHAGHWLQDHLHNNFGHTDPQILHHAHLGAQLLWWVIPLFVVSAGMWAIGRRYDLVWRPADGPDRRALPVWVTAVIALVAVGVAVGTLVWVVRIGESGSRAIWPAGSTTG